MPAYPAARLLVPADTPTVSDDFTTVRSPLVQGLPHFIDLTTDLRLKVTLPTGLMRRGSTRHRRHWSRAVTTKPNRDRTATQSTPRTFGVLRCASTALRRGSRLSSLPAAAGASRSLPMAGMPYRALRWTSSCWHGASSRAPYGGRAISGRSSNLVGGSRSRRGSVHGAGDQSFPAPPTGCGTGDALTTRSEQNGLGPPIRDQEVGVRCHRLAKARSMRSRSGTTPDGCWSSTHADSDGTITDEPAASFRSTDYYATIDAHLQDGLQGGAFAFTIEGLVDSDYQAISQGRPRRPVVAKLYLFWNDVPSGPLTYLSNLAGLSGGPSPAALSKALVAVLYVTDIKRKLGSMTYDTEIHAVEWAFRMMRQPLQSPLREDFYRSVCLDIYERTQIAVNTFPDSGRLTVDRAGTPGSEKVNYPTGKDLRGDTGRDRQSREGQPRSARAPDAADPRWSDLSRPPRPFPLERRYAKPLTVATGLLEATADGSSDPRPDAPRTCRGGRNGPNSPSP